jgi:cytochrome c oxidase subunit I+III
VVLIDFVQHFRSQKRPGHDPWDAPSLEWVSSWRPFSFRSLMPITTRYPAWEQPNLKTDGEAGRGYLPDAPTGERESMVTTPIDARPVQIIRLPKPGWTAFLASAASAAAMGAATIGYTTVGLVAGSAAAAVFLYWLWSLDRGAPREHADAGRGLALPLYSNGLDHVGAWGLVVFLVSDAAVLASLVFAYLFLWTVSPGSAWPPHDSKLPGVLAPTTIAALVVAANIAFEFADRLNQRGRRLATGAYLLASAVLAIAGVTVAERWLHELIVDPSRHSYEASVTALVRYADVHVAVAAGMAAWCMVRLACGLIDSWRCLTLRICTLWWRFTSAATVLTLVAVTGFPHAISR